MSDLSVPIAEVSADDLRVEHGVASPNSVTPFTFDVAIVGLGYVGLPTALAFHAAGRRTLGIDISKARLAAIASGRVDLLESDRERLAATADDDTLTFAGDLARLAEAKAVLICVPTPVDEYLMPALGILEGACAAVVEHAVAGQILMMTSTTYVGSTEAMLVRPLELRGFRVGQDIHVAFSPERIDPGNDRHAHEDVARVVGGITPACTSAAIGALSGYAANLHAVSSARAAEMTKLLENTFRAVNIALANEVADASRALNLDVIEVIDAAATKPYGFMAFYPGPGVGGHCIPCDPHYLLWQLRKERIRTPIIEHAMAGIAHRPGQVVDRVGEVLSSRGRAVLGAKILVLGVAYKPNVEDLRESPAVEIMQGLASAGAHVDYHDPLISCVRIAEDRVLESVEDPAKQAYDIVVFHTPHREVDLSWIRPDQLVLDATYRLATPADRVLL